MGKEILGWNDDHSGYYQEVEFFRAPFWLRLLARTFYFERYAYPHAAKLGLIYRYPKVLDEVNSIPCTKNGIEYTGELHPKFKNQELTEFKMPIDPNNPPKKGRTSSSYFIGAYVNVYKKIIFNSPLGNLRTVWGKQRKDAYTQAVIRGYKINK